MYIKHEDGEVRNLKVPGMDEPVDIPESGVLQVTKEVGEALIKHCPNIKEYTAD